jgi:hypothetical protein
MPADQKPRDLSGMVMAVLFIGVGAWILLESRHLSALGSVFPSTIAIALILFSLILLGMNLRRPRAAAAPAGADERESTPRRLLLVAIMIGWSLLMPVVGFFVSSLIAFVALLVVAEYERWSMRHAVLYGMTAVVVVAAFYFLMRDILLIPVPRGQLF